MFNYLQIRCLMLLSVLSGLRNWSAVEVHRTIAMGPIQNAHCNIYTRIPAHRYTFTVLTDPLIHVHIYIEHSTMYTGSLQLDGHT